MMSVIMTNKDDSDDNVNSNNSDKDNTSNNMTVRVS
jgi:hypothetical protein